MIGGTRRAAGALLILLLMVGLRAARTRNPDAGGAADRRRTADHPADKDARADRRVLDDPAD